MSNGWPTDLGWLILVTILPDRNQYAQGIVVYEWLTGDRPFHGSAIEIVTQHLAISPAPLREKAPTIPPEVEHVVLTALAKDAKERFGSVQAFANALEQASQSGVPTFVKPILPEAQPHRVEMSSKPIVKPVVTPLSPTQIVTPSESVGSVLYKYRGHSGSVNTVAWSPDWK
jgi:serine/threonine protein kinase